MLTKALTAVDFRSKTIDSFDNLEKNSIGFLCISKKFIPTR